MLGQYTGGRIAEQRDPRYSLLVFHLITIPAAVCMALGNEAVLVGLAFVFFFFLLGMQPMENTLVACYTPRRLHHSAYGMKFVLTFGIGALAVKMVGLIESRFSLEASFYALAICSTVLVISVAVLIAATRSPDQITD